MDAKVAQTLGFSSVWVDFKKDAHGVRGAVRLSRRFKEPPRLRVHTSARRQSLGASWPHRRRGAELSCTCKNNPAPILESGSFHAPLDGDLLLKNISKEVEPYLNGRCIYLVGMMGSGKTTVGKILSQGLNYSFCDSDILVEQDVGISVAEIFKLYGEGFFREKETEALQKLSLMHRLVISTGGGAVVRPINWRYMQKGISVWLDVPLDALARRIVDVGTNSRPLLHHESGDAYTKTLMRLATLWEERGEAYANANVKVSLECIAGKIGQGDVCKLSPTAIAIEALEQIWAFLKGESGITIAGF